MNRILKGKGLGVLAVALTTLLLVTACAPAPTTLPSGEKKVVEVGNLTPLTGPASTAEHPCYQAIQDYVRYFNEEKGIPGVTIKVVWLDMGREMGKFISGYRRLADRGLPLIFSNDTTSLETLRAQFEKDQIPFLAGTTTGPVVHPPGWVFCGWATFGEATTGVFDYFMENWKEERPPKLQFFAADSPFGRGPAEEGTKHAESIGFEVLPIEVCGYAVIDATPQLLRIEAHEADLVYIQNIIPAAGPILRDVERLGLHDKIQFSGTEWAVGETLMQMAPVAVEGFLTPRSLPWFDETEVPGVKTMIDSQLKYHGKVQERPEYMAGWVYGAIMCEAVKRAIEEVGYDNLDGLAVKRALESMKDFDVDGLAKITYGPERRRGSRMIATHQIQGDKIVRLTDWKEAPILVP